MVDRNAQTLNRFDAPLYRSVSYERAVGAELVQERESGRFFIFHHGDLAVDLGRMSEVEAQSCFSDEVGTYADEAPTPPPPTDRTHNPNVLVNRADVLHFLDGLQDMATGAAREDAVIILQRLREAILERVPTHGQLPEPTYLIQTVSLSFPDDSDCQVVRADDNVRVYRGSRVECERFIQRSR